MNNLFGTKFPIGSKWDYMGNIVEVTGAPFRVAGGPAINIRWRDAGGNHREGTVSCESLSLVLTERAS